MPNITPNEQAVLDTLKNGALKINDDMSQQQKDLYKFMMDALAEEFNSTEKESTVQATFAALQKGIGAYKAKHLDAVVESANEKAAAKIADYDKAVRAAGQKLKTTDLSKLPGNLQQHSEDVEGIALLKENAQLMIDAVLPNIQGIYDAAAASLPTDGKEVMLDVSYSNAKEIATKVHLVPELISLDVKGRVQRSGSDAENKVGFTEQGTIRKGGKFHSPQNISGASDRYVVPDDLTVGARDNGLKDETTLYSIGEAWLRANNFGKGKTLPATSYNGKPFGAVDFTVTETKNGKSVTRQMNWNEKSEAVKNWLVRANDMRRADMSYCDDTKFEGYIMRVGDELAIPKSDKPIAPFQYSTRCVACETRSAAAGEKIDVKPPTVMKLMPPPVVPIVPVDASEQEKPPVKTPEPHFTAVDASPSSQKGKIEPYTTQWFAELAAMNNKEIAKEYYALRNQTTDWRVKQEARSAEYGAENYLLQGKNRGGNKDSRRDDASADEKFDLNGKGKGTADKGRPFTTGSVVKYEDDLSMKINDKTVVRFIDPENAARVVAGVTIDLGNLPPRLIPSIYKPSEQLSLFSKTSRYGLSEMRFAMAQVNLGGKDNVSGAQHTHISNPLPAPIAVGADMFLRNDQAYFEKKMAEVDAATDDATRKAAAIEALVAFRDIRENPMVRTADGQGFGPFASNQAALNKYLIGKGIDVESIAKDIEDTDKYPGYIPTVMSKKDQEEVKKAPAITEECISGMSVEGSDKLYAAAKKRIMGMRQSAVELQIAHGKFNELSESAAVTTARDTVKMLFRNADDSVNTAGVSAYTALLKDDYLGQTSRVAVGQGLSDMLKNPSNYNFKTKDEAEAFVKDILGDSDEGKKAFADVSQRGNTPRLPGLHDKPFAVADIKVIGAALAKRFEANPEKLVAYAEKVSGEETTKLSDGRPHAVEFIYALGESHNYSGAHNLDSKVMKESKAAVGKDREEDLQNKVADIVGYVNSGMAGFSIKAREEADNIMMKAQASFDAGNKIDHAALFKELTGTESRKKFLMESLKQRPMFAQNVFLATMVRDPQALKGMIADLKVQGDGISNGLQEQDTLRKVLERVQEGAEKYAKSGKTDKDYKNHLEQAVQDYTVFFTKLADYSNDKKQNKKAEAGQRDSAWDGLMTIVGDNVAYANAMKETIGQDEAMLYSFLSGASRVGGIGSLQHDRVPNQVNAKSVTTDPYYNDALYVLPTDKKGNVELNKNMFKRNKATVNKDVVLRFANGGATPDAVTNQNGADQNDITLNLPPAAKEAVERMRTGRMLGRTEVPFVGKNDKNMSAEEKDTMVINGLTEYLQKQIDEKKSTKLDGTPYTPEEIKKGAEAIYRMNLYTPVENAKDLVMMPNNTSIENFWSTMSNVGQQDGKSLVPFLLLLIPGTPKTPVRFGLAPICLNCPGG